MTGQDRPRRTGPQPELGPPGPVIDRPRRADEHIPARAVTGSAAVQDGPGRQWPPGASGPDRQSRVDAGLYAHGRSDPALRPATPDGETDSFDAPPLPPGKAPH